MWLMTKLGENSYMTEDGFSIEVMELSADLLVWAASRDGNYDSQCELLIIGAIRDKPQSEWELSMGIRSLWLDEVCRGFNPDHPLCISTTESFRRQLAEMEGGEAVGAATSENVDWKAEGF